MTLPKARLKRTSLRGLSQRELETEYNRIWEEIEGEIKETLKALLDNDLRIRNYDDLEVPISVPANYSKFLRVYDSEDNFIGFIPIFS